MARRRGRDRVVGLPATGGSLLLDPSVSLPRSTYRDIERLSGTFDADGAVYGRFAPFGSARHSQQRSLLYGGTLRARRPSEFKRSFPPAKQVLFNLSELPSRVRFCVQRKRRREVLFAFKRAGYSGSAKKRSWRRSISSKYGC